MARKKSKEQIIAAIEKHKNNIGRERDKLRDLVSDLETILESVDDAHDSLIYAIDRLSEHL